MPRSFLISRRYLAETLPEPTDYHAKWQETEKIELVDWLVNLYTVSPNPSQAASPKPKQCYVAADFSPRKAEDQTCQPVDLSMKKTLTSISSAEHDNNNNNHTTEDDKLVAENRPESPQEYADGAHSCPDCGKRYSTSSNLARHRQTHRSINDRKARHCPHCGKVYVSMPAFSMHVRTHNQGCECSICGKSFSRPWLLQGHLRTHTGEKPFKCDHCGKSFADKSNLRAHIQTHSAEKPYECQRCQKTFALKSYLYKHEESSCLRKERPASRKS